MSENRYEQHAEKLTPQEIMDWYVDLDGTNVYKKLLGRGAKLLSAPRGAGKSMLLKRAYYACLSENKLPIAIYVNYSQYFRVEHASQNKPNSLIIFRRWVLAKIALSLLETANDLILQIDDIFNTHKIDHRQLNSFVSSLEGGTSLDYNFNISPDSLCQLLEAVCDRAQRPRVIILLDDAAHAFTPDLQREFFDLFRALNRIKISPKAAVYPGVTSYGAKFNIGHDAEILSVGLSPESEDYNECMISVLRNRLTTKEFEHLADQDGLIDLLAYASSGLPRALIFMAGYCIDKEKKIGQKPPSPKGWEAINAWNEYIQNLYNSVSVKIPRFRNYIKAGKGLYLQLVDVIKKYNYSSGTKSFYIGIEENQSPRYEMVIQFLEYSGILFPRGTISRGGRGVYQRFLVHIGLLIEHKSFISSRGKSFKLYSDILRKFDKTNYPRIAYNSLLEGKLDSRCTLEIPPCPFCNTIRSFPEAKYCHSCGKPLPDVSIYSEIIKQPISILPLPNNKIKVMKESGHFSTIADLLTENSISKLYKLPHVDKVWAERIWQTVQEFTSS